MMIMSLIAAYVFVAVQIDVLAKTQSPMATRAYCDHNVDIAVSRSTLNIQTNLPSIVSQEVELVSQRFVTNAYPVPIPVTNTVYVDTVISNQIIYQTTQTEVYATISYNTNVYVNIYTNTYFEYITNINVQVETNYVNFTTNVTVYINTNVLYETTYHTNVNTYIDTIVYSTNVTVDVNTNVYIDTFIATNITKVQQFIVDVETQTNSYFEVGIDGKLRLYYNGIIKWEEK